MQREGTTATQTTRTDTSKDHSDRERILEFAGAIYDVAVDPATWPKYLNLIRKILRGGACAIVQYDIETGLSRVCFSSGLSDVWRARYDEQAAAHDPWFAQSSALLKPGQILREVDVDSRAARRDDDPYHNWRKGQRLGERIGAVLTQTEDSVFCLVAYRDGARGKFAAKDVENLEVLTPHLRRATEVYLHFRQMQEERDRAIDTLDCLPISVLLVDRNAALLGANARGHKLLESQVGLTHRDGVVRATESRLTQQLHNAIAAAAQHARTPLDKSKKAFRGRVVVIPRRGGSPLSVVAESLQGQHPRLGEGDAGAVLFVSDPQEQTIADSDAIRMAFGLTPTEARVTALLASGLSLTEAAKVLNIGVGTARVHLKRIFSKTGTNRQAELVSLVLGTVSPFHMA